MLVVFFGAMNAEKRLIFPTKGVKEKKPKKHSSPAKSSYINTKLKALEHKWSERFSRLKTLLVARTFGKQELTFHTVIVAPIKAPPAGAVKISDPFILPYAPVD